VALLFAWVLWENVTGVINGRAMDFWLLKTPFETRKECLAFAAETTGVMVGEFPESLLWQMEKASRDQRRPGWKLERKDPWVYTDRSPDGKSFERRELQCWPSGTDPRPRIGEPR
jgi:hypothetical protein